MPAPQGRQFPEVLPAGVDRYRPAAHGVHAVEPVAAAYTPAPHSVQLYAPEAEYSPAAQLAHCADVAAARSAEAVPGVHSVQPVLPVRAA